MLQLCTEFHNLLVKIGPCFPIIFMRSVASQKVALHRCLKEVLDRSFVPAKCIINAVDSYC